MYLGECSGLTVRLVHSSEDVFGQMTGYAHYMCFCFVLFNILLSWMLLLYFELGVWLNKHGKYLASKKRGGKHDVCTIRRQKNDHYSKQSMYVTPSQ